METEYKYRLDDVSLIQEIIDDPMLDEYVDRDSWRRFGCMPCILIRTTWI